MTSSEEFDPAEGIHGPLADWARFNVVEAFQQAGAKDFVAPFPPRVLMHETTGCASDEEFAWHGSVFLKSFAEACPVPLASLGAVLDFGVGVGRLARMFHGFRGRYVGVDIDERNTTWVAENLRHVEPVLTTPGEPLPFPDDAFDAVFSISVFSHMTEADCRFYVNELARVTRPGGVLVLSTHGRIALDRALADRKVAALLAMSKADLKVAKTNLDGPRRFHFHKQNTHLSAANYDYGMTFLTPTFMEAIAPAKFPLVEAIPGALGEFQDLLILRAAPPAARAALRPSTPAPVYTDPKRVITGPFARTLSLRYYVDTAIAPRDYLMVALIWSQKDVAKAFEQYIADGRYNVAAIQELIRLHHHRPPGAEGPLRLLDFASGYGRLGRHVANIMPDARYTGMDIHAEAVAFMRHRLGLDALLSDFDPRALPGMDAFEVAFASSFFSHLRKEAIEPWLAGLRDLVVVGGTLIITTHGARSHETVMRECRVAGDGYGMLETSEQRDISTAHYVHAVTLEPFMRARIKAVPGLEIVAVELGTWLGHQDVYVLRRIPADPRVLADWKPSTFAAYSFIERLVRKLGRR